MNRARNRQSMRRTIVKQGYLRKLPNYLGFGSTVKKPDQQWFVFGMIENLDPYLECYNTEDDALFGQPIKTVFINTLTSIKKDSDIARNSDNVFTLMLKDQKVSFMAPSRQNMLQWCEAIDSRLLRTNDYKKKKKGGNDYVIVPNVTKSLRRHKSQPEEEEEEVDEWETMATPAMCVSRYKIDSLRHRMQQRAMSLQAPPPAPLLQGMHGRDDDSDTYENLWQENLDNGYEVPVNLRDSDALRPNPPPPREVPPTPPSAELVGLNTTLPPYSPHSASLLPRYSPTSSSLPISPPITPTVCDGQAICEKSLEDEAESLPLAPTLADAIAGAGVAPPPYTPRSSHEEGSTVALKESQVQQLIKEQSNPNGQKVIMTRADCYQTVLFVDAFHAVWVAGWNHTARPMLSRAFHLGDQLVTLNGVAITSSKQAQKIIKQHKDRMQMTFILRRLPKAKILLLKRSYDGEKPGFERIGSTGEISRINTNGLAFLSGELPEKAPSIGGQGECNWYLTEVNNRPLNLFFKGDEIEQRLNAVGRELTLVLQPSDFINSLKKLLKSSKNYKTYLLQ